MTDQPIMCPDCGDHELLCESVDGKIQYGLAPEVEYDFDGAYFPTNGIVYCPDCGEIMAHDVADSGVFHPAYH